MIDTNLPQVDPTEVPVQPEELTPEQRELSVKLLDEKHEDHVVL